MITRYRGRHRRSLAMTIRAALATLRRNPLPAAVAVTGALWLGWAAVDGGYYVEALRPARAAVGVSLLPPPCTGEDGTGTLPCRWECATMGNRQCGPMTPERLIYRPLVTRSGGMLVCAAPGPMAEICAEADSVTSIEFVGSDGRLYRLAGGG